MNDITPRPQGEIAFQVDLGNERQFDLEFSADEDLWLTAGPGIQVVNIWSKSVIGELDLRVSIRRTVDGLEVIVDRGQEDAPWWSAGASPRLIIGIDPSNGIASASARAGGGADLRETVLGRTTIRSG